MEKVDFDQVAHSYDRGRTLPSETLRLWLDLFQRYSCVGVESRVLDLGCGTGRFSIPIAKRIGCQLFGVDSSVEMLAAARRKQDSNLVTWCLQDAHTLAFTDSTFDSIFCSQLFQNVHSPASVVDEAKRVLRSFGSAFFRYSSLTNIRTDFEHSFFSEALSIDGQRYPESDAVERMLRRAGFEQIFSITVRQRTYMSATHHLLALRHKGLSLLHLLSQQCYSTGIRDFEAYVKEHGDDPSLLYSDITASICRKAQ